MACSRAARLTPNFTLPIWKAPLIRFEQLGHERYDEAGRTLDFVGVEQGEAVRPHVDEALLECEPIVLGMCPDVGKGDLPEDEA
jgi:hypothetical protein